MAIEKLACNTGRNDEIPNIELAEELCAEKDGKGIKEIADGLHNENEAVANDCIKVLYEIGQRKPELISDYVPVFLSLLASKNNRLIWGAMTALSYTASLRPDEIFSHIDTVIKAYEKGSVITIDTSITVFASLCSAQVEYEKKIFPLLLKHFQTCRPKEVCQHAERALICITQKNRNEFLSVLQKRVIDLTESQMKRLQKVIKKIQEL